MIGVPVWRSIGWTMIGVPAWRSIGCTMIGGPAVWRSIGWTMIGVPACVEDAATAGIANAARTEPSATHETFNHDEDIWLTPLDTTESAEKTNAKIGRRYNKSTEVTQENVKITFTCIAL